MRIKKDKKLKKSLNIIEKIKRAFHKSCLPNELPTLFSGEELKMKIRK